MHAATADKHDAAAVVRPEKQGWQVFCHPFVCRLALAVAMVVLAAAVPARAADIYHYAMGSALSASEQGELAALLPADVVVRSAQVRVDGQHQPLAELELAETDRGPVLLDWQARVDDPFLTLAPPRAETVALAAVIRRHVPDDAVLLSWWDVSRQLQLLAAAPVVFNQPLGVPLFVPNAWRKQAADVAATEAAFWRATETDQWQAQRADFDRFVQALLAPEQEGVAALRALGTGAPVVLVLHLRDLILLGQMAPQGLGVAFRDFGTLSEVHGMIQRVRAWMRENGHAAYGLLQGGSKAVRAVALTDTASSQTLAARLLPLVGNDQGDVAGTRLVYRTGGYIVFEIDADDPHNQ